MNEPRLPVSWQIPGHEIASYLVGSRYLIHSDQSGMARVRYCFDLATLPMVLGPRSPWDGPNADFVIGTSNCLVSVSTMTVRSPISGLARDVYRANLGEPLAAVPPTVGSRREPASRPASRAAEEIRSRSGLSIEQLAGLFPTSRENFHRWLAGRTRPTTSNFERLLALRHLIRSVGERVDDVRVWLLTPLEDSLSSATPYSLIARGQLSTLWPVVARLQSRQQRTKIRDSEGGRGVRISQSLRGNDARTPEDEIDDAADWFGSDDA
jgi:hypothetical protein